MPNPAQQNALSFNEVREIASRDPEAFATSLLGEAPTQRSGGQVRYNENQSLVVFTAGPNQGRFKSFLDENAKGSMIDMVIWTRGLPDDRNGRHEAVEIAKGLLGLSDGAVDLSKLPPIKSDAEKRREREQLEAKKLRTARWIWNQASETDGRDEGLAYLANRGITCEIPASTLRFRKLTPDNLDKMGVKACDIPETPVTALIFAARDANGDIRAVQQILVTEGRKVAFENPKRTNGLMEGAAVWLGDPGAADKAVLVEGPETGCSIHQATGLPVCIALGTSNFTKISMPKTIRNLIVASDMEPTGVGLASALRTAQHWAREGVEEVSVALPVLNDGDFNDVHQAQGEGAVRTAIERSYSPRSMRDDGTVLVTPDARAAFYAWLRTGVEVAPRVPGRDKERKFYPLSLDAVVEDRHNRVLIVGNPSIEIRDDVIRTSRPDLEIIQLHEDSRRFRALARQEGALEAAIDAVDIHAPDGHGDTEPVYFALRRKDAIALNAPGSKSMAVRASAVDRVNLDFMKGREAIVAPIGQGTDYDRRLAARLQEAGADVTSLTWQIFRADEGSPSILRREVPIDFGAADAAEEGWTGEALTRLVAISKANRQQMAGLPDGPGEHVPKRAARRPAAR